MKKGLKIVLILLVSIVLTGCWNYREVNEEFIVTAAAIDKSGDEYIVTVEITFPKKGSEIALETDYIIERGRTVFEAIRKSITQSGKKLYWGHTMAIIISKEVAEEGILPILDFLARDTEVRNKIWLIVSMEENASILLQGKDESHNSIGFHVDETMRNQKNIGMFHSVNLLDFLRDLGAEGIAPTLATAKLVPTRDSKLPSIEGMAVFKDDKMIGLLDALYVKPFLLIVNEFQGGEFTVLDINGEKVSLEVDKSKTKLRPIIKDGEVVMDLNITMEAGIVEMQLKESHINEEKIMLLKNLAEENFSREIEKVIKKVQEEFKVDIFGFGNAIYRLKPKIWKEIRDDWDQKFVNLEVQTDIDIVIKGTGLLEKQIRGEY